MNHKVIFKDLGNIDYKKGWDHQEEIFKQIIAKKLANRVLPENAQEFTENYLIFCEHPHVFTLGKSGDEKNLLLKEDKLKERGIAFYKINRGGDITYHGPGQLVGYPILNLDYFFTDIHKYLRFLEEAVILTLADYSIKGERYEGLTGVWVDPQHPAKARKICAMGVRTSHWVTMHGLALNVNPDLQYFSLIVPCGISDKAVTSMAKELNYIPDAEEVKQKLKKYLAQVFDAEYTK